MLSPASTVANSSSITSRRAGGTVEVDASWRQLESSPRRHLRAERQVVRYPLGLLVPAGELHRPAARSAGV